MEAQIPQAKNQSSTGNDHRRIHGSILEPGTKFFFINHYKPHLTNNGGNAKMSCTKIFRKEKENQVVLGAKSARGEPLKLAK